MTYAWMKYWVEGEKETLQTLFEAIKNGEGWAEKSLKNLGVNTEEYETFRAEWCRPKLLEKDGETVLYFEEYYPYERGTLIDQLFEEEKFEGKLTHIYYYAEEAANAEMFVTNDEDGKYWPNRFLVRGEMLDDMDIYCKDEGEAVNLLHEKLDFPSSLKTIDDINNYFIEEKGKDEDDTLYYTKIEVVFHPFADFI